MRKVIVVTFVMLALMTTAAWGQQDALLGPHDVGSEGCIACHAPHNALPGKSMYLWGREIPTGTYNTYGGGTVKLALNASTGESTDTATHTILCLSCHDTTFSGVTAVHESTTLGSNNAIGKGGDLTHDHPVHVVYPQGDPTFFNVTIGAAPDYRVSFSDSSATAFAYGHPARLYSAGDGNAYVECSSCHNPHAWKSAVQTTSTGKKAVTTVKFLRGAYVLGSSTTNYDGPNFCMSCHMFPAAAFDGTVK